jgi:hypothetical protein
LEIRQTSTGRRLRETTSRLMAFRPPIMPIRFTNHESENREVRSSSGSLLSQDLSTGGLVR